MAELVQYFGTVYTTLNSNLQPVASRKVFITKRGGTCKQTTTGTNVQLSPGAARFRFTIGDFCMLEKQPSTTSAVTAIGAVGPTFATLFTQVLGDRLINLGGDSGGGGSPAYDGADDLLSIYAVPDSTTTATVDNQVTTNADGEYSFWIEAGVGFDINIMDTSNALGANSQTIPDQVLYSSERFSQVLDSATAVAHSFDTLNTLSTAGSLIASFRNAGTEKVKIDKDGDLKIAGDLTIDGTSTLTGNVTLASMLDFGSYTAFTDQDATPSVANGSLFKTVNTVATTITQFDGSTDGQFIAVWINDAFTTMDFSGAGFKGNNGVDIILQTNDLVFGVYESSTNNWYLTIVENSSLNGTTAAIASGVASIRNNDIYRTLAAETGTTDTLVTLNGGRSGQVVTLAADTGDTITIDENGNFLLNIDATTTSTIVLTGTDKAQFMWDASKWSLMSNHGGALA